MINVASKNINPCSQPKLIQAKILKPSMYTKGGIVRFFIIITKNKPINKAINPARQSKNTIHKAVTATPFPPLKWFQNGKE